MAIIHTYYKYGGTIETHFSQSGPEFMLYAAIEHVIIIFQSSGIKARDLMGATSNVFLSTHITLYLCPLLFSRNECTCVVSHSPESTQGSRVKVRCSLEQVIYIMSLTSPLDVSKVKADQSRQKYFQSPTIPLKYE